MVTTDIFNDFDPTSLPITEPVDPDLEAELEVRFGPQRIGELCTEFIEEGAGFDVRELLGDRQFLVSYIRADSPFSDIPRAVETTVFAKAFKLPLSNVLLDYGKYDAGTTFAAVIDCKTPVAAGALRIIDYAKDLGFKDVNDLVIDDAKNPWITEIKERYFSAGEQYDPNVAWLRLGEVEGVRLDLERSLDIATHAAATGYDGKNGSVDGVSMLFYHACLRWAQSHQKDNLLAIFDLKPFDNLQKFGGPFSTYSRLEAHPYGGPFDTIPAFCVVKEGVRRIYEFDEGVGDVFAKAATLDGNALLPNEYDPEMYSNEAVETLV